MYFPRRAAKIRIKQFVGKVNIQVIDINGRVVYSVKNEYFSSEKLNLNDLTSEYYSE
jgi:hypothetical protein